MRCKIKSKGSREKLVSYSDRRYRGHIMDKEEIILTGKTEFLRHTWVTFSDGTNPSEVIRTCWLRALALS